jgi:small conductance mechanosensitive channel
LERFAPVDVNLQQLSERLVLFAPRLVTAILVLAAAWVGARIASRVVSRLGRHVRSVEVVDVLARTITLAILALGIVSSLGTIGVNVMGLVAGLGLAGFAIGFALKDALSNALSGILVLVYRPFARGDRITVTGFEGVVSGIDLRYTTLSLDDGRIALVPNAAIFSNAIVVRHHATEAAVRSRDPSTRIAARGLSGLRSFSMSKVAEPGRG